DRRAGHLDDAAGGEVVEADRHDAPGEAVPPLQPLFDAARAPFFRALALEGFERDDPRRAAVPAGAGRLVLQQDRFEDPWTRQDDEAHGLRRSLGETPEQPLELLRTEGALVEAVEDDQRALLRRRRSEGFIVDPDLVAARVVEPLERAPHDVLELERAVPQDLGAGRIDRQPARGDGIDR